jgi:glucose 1-dehydrogenase
MAPLEGRRALVTGASSGIGRATAVRLAADGAVVAVNHLPGAEDDAAEVVREAERAGGRAFPVQGDVSREGDVTAMFAAAHGELGAPVDLLVNNAGIEKPFPLEEMPLDEWQRVLEVNLTGPFLCSREFVRGIDGRAPEGSAIVNVSSVHEVIPWPSFAHYCASKGGLKLFGETIARELAPRGIRVVGVAPGAILTPINKELMEDSEKRREQEEQIPWGRLGTPEEIAAAIAWLAGGEAEYVTGTTLFVDGGMTLYPKFV